MNDVWKRVKQAGFWFAAGFASGAVVTHLVRSGHSADDSRADERVTRAELDGAVAELRDIVGDIGTGVHVAQSRLEDAQRAADVIERGLGYVGDGIDGIRDATRGLRELLERAEAGNRCPYCGAGLTKD